MIYFRVCHYHSQIRLLTSSIDDIEKECLKKLKVTEEYKALTSIPGIGPILAMVILVETGHIERFAKSGNYSSYCRCVNSQRTSNGKNKGKNNTKNGNKFLSWAFAEATITTKRFCPEANRYWQRKIQKHQKWLLINL